MMSNLINDAWPVGKIFDLKVKAVSENGPLNLMDALNGRADFVDGVELLAMGFITKIDSERSALEAVMGFIERVDRGDYSALEEAKQFIIEELNNKHEVV